MTYIKEQFLNELRQELNSLELSTRPVDKNTKWGHLESMADRVASSDKLSNECTDKLNILLSKDEFKTIDPKNDIELFEKIKLVFATIIKQRIQN
jgi:hypothetical protein